MLLHDDEEILIIISANTMTIDSLLHLRIIILLPLPLADPVYLVPAHHPFFYQLADFLLRRG